MTDQIPKTFNANLGKLTLVNLAVGYYYRCPKCHMYKPARIQYKEKTYGGSSEIFEITCGVCDFVDTIPVKKIRLDQTS